MTQAERLLARLDDGPLCAMEPLDWSPRIYRVAARIKDLRNRGHVIITERKCSEHGGAAHALYRLEKERLF